MKLESVVIDDTLAAAVDRLFPDSTWCELITFALGIVVDDALAADAADDVIEVTAAPDADLEQRIRSALTDVTP